MIYVASSWLNQEITAVIQALRGVGHEVYDFREEDGFSWRDVDPAWQTWSPAVFREQLASSSLAIRGFERDMVNLRAADALVLVLPCGRSAHLELGYAIGAGKPTVILLAPGEPELMYRAASRLCISIEEVLEYFNGKREIEAGDSVRHYPSGEDWLLLGVNRLQDEVCVAGWPASRARLQHCALISKGQGLSQRELDYRAERFGSNWDATRVRPE